MTISLPVDDGHAGPGDPGNLFDTGLDFLHGVEIDDPGVGHQFVFDLRFELRPDLVAGKNAHDPDGKHRDDQVGPENLEEKLPFIQLSSLFTLQMSSGVSPGHWCLTLIPVTM